MSAHECCPACVAHLEDVRLMDGPEAVDDRKAFWGGCCCLDTWAKAERERTPPSSGRDHA